MEPEGSTKSKRKRKRVELEVSPEEQEHEHSDAAVDRISNLPDSILCHILSFLPTKEAVATSILSSSWKPLWTLVPALDLDTQLSVSQSQCLDSNNRTQSVSFFTHIVSRVLALNKAPVLRDFCLTCHSRCDPLHLETWILTAIARDVQQLQLDICLDGFIKDEFYSGELFVLPQSFFSCKTVVILELWNGIKVDPPSSFEFPSLKDLRLVHVFFRNGDCVQRLLSGCPVLQDLKLCSDSRSGLIRFDIRVPTLKYLCLQFLTFEPSLPDYKLAICAPALKCFHFDGDLRHVVFLEKLANLVEAGVWIHPFICTREAWTKGYQIGYGDRVFRLLKALNKAKSLTLYPGKKQCVDFGSIYPSRFKNLVRLNFTLQKSNWHVLQALLRVSPNLEVLVIDKLYSRTNQLCSMEPFDGPGYEARVLKTATISVCDTALKESVIEELSKFPRSSTTCLLTVEVQH
ncbi:F-box/LRR-repeat protein At3g26922-like isoform X2 [Quercus lobata]|uniref:F-box/LRR-repeat protein At3g26922-like isoform X2 n=1 Tax=Quercus lobata TaxID=97700 RepID=UPI0012449C79|nr:F-box/LRR-repeat protein At3g26922-like isoform X2 [Quercus lobata]